MKGQGGHTKNVCIILERDSLKGPYCVKYISGLLLSVITWKGVSRSPQSMKTVTPQTFSLSPFSEICYGNVSFLTSSPYDVIMEWHSSQPHPADTSPASKPTTPALTLNHWYIILGVPKPLIKSQNMGPLRSPWGNVIKCCYMTLRHY